ncbi:MAG: flagellar assembly protein FliW [Verrucomicrobia bacterium]|nr:flagellar assembly protein FliW [Verrucomicrobiota bacterium]
MKVLDESTLQATPVAPPALELTFPNGIVGFPEHRRGEVFHFADQLPFQWLRLHGPSPLHFVVIDPIGLLPDYAPELFDDDATALGIIDSSDALVLNIVTVRDQASTANVNLVGPIIINRHTGVARQVVVANHTQFSARHPLVTAS